ncbi:MAG: hypothetical protein ABLQ96_04845 [Candidatus Acidiferrum sp.]
MPTTDPKLNKDAHKIANEDDEQAAMEEVEEDIAQDSVNREAYANRKDAPPPQKKP